MTPRAVLRPARFAGSAVLRTQSDARLVDMTRAGNDRAFEAIVERYRRPLLRHCARLLSPARAEDAVQQALVNAYRALTRSEDELDLRPWLLRIAHNAALNALRAGGPATAELDEGLSAQAGEGPHHAAERAERLRDVVASIKQLPENQRAAVLLQAFEGCSHDEIATALELSGGAVRQLLHRARQTLRAGATALLPGALLNRLTGEAWAAPAAQRVAELTAGGGLAAGGAAKAGVALLTAGVIAGGATGALPVAVPGAGDGGAKAIAATPGGGDSGSDPEALALAPANESELDRVERSASRRARIERRRERAAEERRERRRDERDRDEDDDSESDDDERDEDDDERDADDERSGPGDGESRSDDDDRSGPGDGDSRSDDDDDRDSGDSGASDDIDVPGVDLPDVDADHAGDSHSDEQPEDDG